MRPVAIILATAGGAGFAPIAPGTFGAAVGVALCWLAVGQGVSLAVYLLATALVTAVGVWACSAAEAAFERKDDGRIVIDEVAGQLLALAPVLVWARGDAFIPSLVTGFVLFRVFDIAKPGPVRWAERAVPGGAGVMADDVVAGLLAGALLAAGLLVMGATG